MNLSALATELAKPEYVSMTDQQAANAINAKTVLLRQLVPTWRVKQYAIEQAIWPKIVLVREDNEQSDLVLRGLCISVVSWIDDPSIETIDVDLPKVQEMLAGLVAYAIATQEQASAIVAMGSVTVAWTTHNGLPEIGRGLVANIRRENT
jgi:hypothetical protein